MNFHKQLASGKLEVELDVKLSLEYQSIGDCVRVGSAPHPKCARV